MRTASATRLDEARGALCEKDSRKESAPEEFLMEHEKVSRTAERIERDALMLLSDARIERTLCTSIPLAPSPLAVLAPESA